MEPSERMQAILSDFHGFEDQEELVLLFVGIEMKIFPVEYAERRQGRDFTVQNPVPGIMTRVVGGYECPNSQSMSASPANALRSIYR